MCSAVTPEDVLIYAVGDIGASRPDPDTLFDFVRPTLQLADVAFMQLELPISERGARLPQVRHTDRSPLSTAPALRRAGFTVASMAGNHCMDWGADAMFDTAHALRENGIGVVGVGANIAEARKPVIAEVKGRRVAFLAYSSILPMGFWAEENRPGCAPMRAWTIYEQVEHDQPGTPSRVHTFPNRDDLQALTDDIRKIRNEVDFVAVSLHWGIHFIPGVIADYQRDVGRAAIDAGADVILGHHAHILKGVDVYKGKPIFYGLNSLFFVVGGIEGALDPVRRVNTGFYDNMVAVTEFSEGKPSVVRIYPITTTFDRPATFGGSRIATGEDARRILARIQKESEPFGTQIKVENDIGVIRIPR